MQTESPNLISSVSDAFLVKTSAASTVGGGSVAVVGSLTLNETAMVVGMIVGLVGLCVQIVVSIHTVLARNQQSRRDDVLLQERIRALRSGAPDVCDETKD